MSTTTSSSGPLRILETQQEAWNAGDVEAFMELGYWQSPELTFLSGGDLRQGYAEVLDRYRDRYLSEGRSMGRLNFSDTQVRFLGDRFALVRGRWHLHYADQEDPQGWFSLVFERFAYGWRIIHDHTSSASDS